MCSYDGINRFLHLYFNIYNIAPVQINYLEVNEGDEKEITTEKSLRC